MCVVRPCCPPTLTHTQRLVEVDALRPSRRGQDDGDAKFDRNYAGDGVKEPSDAATCTSSSGSHSVSGDLPAISEAEATSTVGSPAAEIAATKAMAVQTNERARERVMPAGSGKRRRTQGCGDRNGGGGGGDTRIGVGVGCCDGDVACRCRSVFTYEGKISGLAGQVGGQRRGHGSGLGLGACKQEVRSGIEGGGWDS